MKFAEDIIIMPIITEKSNIEVAQGKYTFRVAKKATKIEIREAIEKLFNVKVVAVNTVNYSGKIKSRDNGRHKGFTPSWKKAIVKIATEIEPETYLDKKGKEITVSRKYKTSIDEFGAVQ